jgi:hypothetical protein
MDSLAAMLILLFQLFFGWCDGAAPEVPTAAPCETGADC